MKIGNSVSVLREGTLEKIMELLDAANKVKKEPYSPDLIRVQQALDEFKKVCEKHSFVDLSKEADRAKKHLCTRTELLNGVEDMVNSLLMEDIEFFLSHQHQG